MWIGGKWKNLYGKKKSVAKFIKKKILNCKRMQHFLIKIDWTGFYITSSFQYEYGMQILFTINSSLIPSNVVPNKITAKVALFSRNSDATSKPIFANTVPYESS